jgi:hypothetical protein
MNRYYHSTGEYQSTRKYVNAFTFQQAKLAVANNFDFFVK